VHSARREVDTAYRLQSEAKRIRKLEAQVREGEATLTDMRSGAFQLWFGDLLAQCSGTATLADIDIEREAANIRYWTAKNRHWARQARIALVSQVRTLRASSRAIRPAPRPREHRPHRQRVASSPRRARAPDEPHPEPVGRLAPAVSQGLDGADLPQQHPRWSDGRCA
jgi:hypothetical protein